MGSQSIYGSRHGIIFQFVWCGWQLNRAAASAADAAATTENRPICNKSIDGID